MYIVSVNKGRNMSRLAVLLVLATLATTVANAAPPFGTWKMNLQKSHFNPAPAPFKSFTFEVEPADNGMIRVTVWVEPLDGTPVQPNSFLMREDGKDYPVTNAPFDSFSITPVDATTSILIEKRDGKIVQKKRRVIDGNIMTDTAIFPDPSHVEVFERQ
jgi:hypothetical protein